MRETSEVSRQNNDLEERLAPTLELIGKRTPYFMLGKLPERGAVEERKLKVRRSITEGVVLKEIRRAVCNHLSIQFGLSGKPEEAVARIFGVRRVDVYNAIHLSDDRKRCMENFSLAQVELFISNRHELNGQKWMVVAFTKRDDWEKALAQGLISSQSFNTLEKLYADARSLIERKVVAKVSQKTRKRVRTAEQIKAAEARKAEKQKALDERYVESRGIADERSAALGFADHHFSGVGHERAIEKHCQLPSGIFRDIREIDTRTGELKAHLSITQAMELAQYFEEMFPAKNVLCMVSPAERAELEDKLSFEIGTQERAEKRKQKAKLRSKKTAGKKKTSKRKSRPKTQKDGESEHAPTPGERRQAELKLSKDLVPEFVTKISQSGTVTEDTSLDAAKPWQHEGSDVTWNVVFNVSVLNTMLPKYLGLEVDTISDDQPLRELVDEIVIEFQLGNLLSGLYGGTSIPQLNPVDETLGSIKEKIREAVKSGWEV